MIIFLSKILYTTAQSIIKHLSQFCRMLIDSYTTPFLYLWHLINHNNSDAKGQTFTSMAQNAKGQWRKIFNG